jgi:glycosyltransferase involved in cell wall biosynthesis
LLDLGLSSIAKYKVLFTLEIVIINDGLNDATESVCKKYKDVFDIKYIFSGHRNVDTAEKRSPVFANNIGVKASTGDIVVLSNPEIYHLDECLNIIIPPLMNNYKFLTIPDFMYFDDTGEFTNTEHHNDVSLLSVGLTGKEAVQMPFFMGMWKKEFLNIGGYDEDFIGCAGDDNDLVDRLLWNGCKHFRTPAKIVHLYHGPRCDSHEHFENPDWVYNYNVRKAGRGKIIRNIGREWGRI